MTIGSPETRHFRPLTLHKVALWLIAVAAAIIVIALVFLLAHQRTTGVLSQNLHTVFWYFEWAANTTWPPGTTPGCGC